MLVGDVPPTADWRADPFDSGAGVWHIRAGVGRDRVAALPALWILILPALYAWRLPVEYQFGRYMMPIIPFVIIYGVVGTALLFQRISLRVLRRTWGLTIGALLAVMVFLWCEFLCPIGSGD